MTVPLSTEPAVGGPAPILTSADVERLLSDGSHDSRLGVLEKVAVHYNAESFRGREAEIAEQIFRLLMRDVTLRVRETLADRLKDNPNAPRDVVVHLAHDVETVALPILQASLVLSDADLISIIEASHDVGKLMAISQRPKVSSRVSEALVETNYPQVVSSLLGNGGAEISERSYEKIADDYRSQPEVTKALVNRYPLPRGLVEKLVGQVSEAVASELRQKYHLSEEDIKKSASDSRDDIMQQLMEGALTHEEIVALATRLSIEDKLTPSLVMTALCRGQLDFFAVALARFAGIPVSNAVKLVSDRGEHGFKGIYEKSGLPESMFDAVRLLLNAVLELQGGDAVPGSMHYANRLVTRVVTLAGDRQIEYLPYFVALIRQNIR
jgi:uncharacterized protein (DUF2336 family)